MKLAPKKNFFVKNFFLKNMKVKLVAILYAITICTGFQRQPAKNTTPDPIVMEIGNLKVSLGEFKFVYEKNNLGDKNAYTAKSVQDYVDLFVKFKLKVQEALDLKLDAADDYKQELEVYRKQLARPYLTENKVTNDLIKQAYDRLKEEINASHIMVAVGQNAAPFDTLLAYNRILDYRKRILAGEDFEKLAQAESDDKSARENKGNLGYFTALQMVYPFETAAYQTPVGKISNIVRTRYGYHLIKINNKRKSNGSIKVAHLMLSLRNAKNQTDSAEVLKKIQAIGDRLKKGEDWHSLCSQFSEDGTTRAKGGELEWFTAGNMIPAFEDAAFKLAKNGQVSEPVLTQYGWHLIRLIERKGIEPYEKLEPVLAQKVLKDDRSELNRTVLINRLKRENNFKEYAESLMLFSKYVNPTLIAGKWSFGKNDISLRPVLFEINAEEKYSVHDFFEFAEGAQKEQPEGSSPEVYMANLYKIFVDQKLIEYEDKHLAEKHKEFKYLYDEYREGILLFKIMEQNVWAKSLVDEAGLKDFFAKNQEKYQWKSRAKVVIYSLENESILAKVQEESRKELYLNEAMPVPATVFSEQTVDLKDAEKHNLDQLTSFLLNDTLSVVELRGYASPNEKIEFAMRRIELIKQYLTNKGVPAVRIAENNRGQIPNNAFPAVQNGRVDYLIFSKAKKTLETQFNKTNPLALKITEGTFEQGANDILNKAKWQVGDQKITDQGRTYWIVIEQILPQGTKKLEEVKGAAISDYQTYLEAEWIKSLKEKYKVVLNEQEIKKLIKG